MLTGAGNGGNLFHFLPVLEEKRGGTEYFAVGEG